MRKLSKLSRTAILFIVTGLGTVGVWSAWMRTRTTRPVNIPITLSSSHVRSREFSVNLDYRYMIEIEATESFQQNKPLSLDRLKCMMGIHHFMNQPIFDLITPGADECGNSIGIVADWSVTSSNELVSQGLSSDSDLGLFAEDKITRVLGAFEGHKDKRYVLDATFRSDRSSLAPTNPRLIVEVDTGFYDESFHTGGLLVLLGAFLVSLGMTLLLVAAFRKRQRSKASASLRRDSSALHASRGHSHQQMRSLHE